MVDPNTYMPTPNLTGVHTLDVTTVEATKATMASRLNNVHTGEEIATLASYFNSMNAEIVQVTLTPTITLALTLTIILILTLTLTLTSTPTLTITNRPKQT